MATNQRDRTTYLGGTAAATIMLGERYGTKASDLCRWYQGQYEMEPLEGNPHVQRGQVLEDVAIERLRQHGWTVRDEQRHCYGASVGLGEYLGGTIDGICTPPGEPTGLLEVKCPSSRNYWKWIDHGVPQGHVWQCRLYMILTGYDLAYIVAFNADDWEHHVWQVESDPELEQQLLSAMDAFWSCVQRGGEWDLQPQSNPPIIGGDSVEADQDMQSLLAEYTRANTDYRYYEQRSKELKNRVIDSWPDDAKRLVAAAGTASWVQPKPATKIDMAKLKNQFPEVYEQCLVVQRRRPYLAIRTADVEEASQQRRQDAIDRAKREARGTTKQDSNTYGEGNA